MPANPKYLSTAKQRWAKVTMAILGGYFFTSILNLVIGVILTDKKPLLATSIWASFLVWTAFMLFVFMAKSFKTVLWSFVVIVAIGVPLIILLK